MNLYDLWGSMSFRYMRLLLFFDLPRYTGIENKEANLFRKQLIKLGFIMLQESVYCKLALNDTVMEAIKCKVIKYLPKNGNVMMLKVTEKQFERMEIFCDSQVKQVIDSHERLVII